MFPVKEIVASRHYRFPGRIVEIKTGCVCSVQERRKKRSRFSLTRQSIPLHSFEPWMRLDLGQIAFIVS